MKILIFGGTKEAIEIANILGGRNHEIIFSLKGVTKNPKLPVFGEVRFGGFGGVEGLKNYLLANYFDLVIDATHPFAREISNNLVDGCELAGVELVRFVRPAWRGGEGGEGNERGMGDERNKGGRENEGSKGGNKNKGGKEKAKQKIKWREFNNIEKAINSLPFKARVFLTTGHKNLELVQKRADCFFLIRTIEPPKINLPDNCQIIIARPPFELKQEISLLNKNNISHLLAKNSGAKQIEAKINAAIEQNIDIYIISRPKLKPAKQYSHIGLLIDDICS